MTAKDVKRLLAALSVSSTRETEQWINASCPLAPWRHASGADRRPSFGVSINPNGRSVWKCFTCSPDGGALHLLIHLAWTTTKQYPILAARILAESEIWLENHVFDSDWAPSTPIAKELPDSVVKKYPLAALGRDAAADAAMQYLESRGIAPTVAHRFGVRYDAQHVGSIVFPLTDVKGRIGVLRYRDFIGNRRYTVSPRIAGCIGRDFPSIRETGVMFGLHLLNQRRPITLVEGEIDALRIVSLGGENVAALSGAAFSATQLCNILAPVVYIGLDADIAGNRAADKFHMQTGARFLKYRIDWTEASSKRHIKDPGDIQTVEQLKRAYKRAVMLAV